MKVTIYKADWCPYCKKALEEIEKLKIVFNFDLEIIDIDELAESPEDIGNIDKIPKIFINGEEITLEELTKRLHSQV